MTRTSARKRGVRDPHVAVWPEGLPGEAIALAGPASPDARSGDVLVITHSVI